MATTQNTYTGNGSNKLFSITFPYLETSDIDVYLNNVLQTITTQYSFANATTIEFVTAPPNGATVKIDRSTDDSELSATFFPGSSIKASDLNDNFDQTLYVVQEINNKAVKLDDPLYANKTYIDAQDATKVNKSGDTMTGNLAMSGNRVTGLGTPSSDADSATKKYVDDRYGQLSVPGVTRWRKTATAGQTTFSGAGEYGGTLAYSSSRETVYVNGALQQRNVDYTANDGATIVFTPALLLGDVVEVHCVNNAAGITTDQASGVYWTQTGSGATTRTVDSKLKDVVSVKDFGAVGDGVADDTAAVIAANAASKYLLFPPGGNYCLMNWEPLADTVVVAHGATISRADNTAFQATGACGALVVTNDRITVMGGTWTRKSGVSSATWSAAILVNGGDDFTVTEATFTDTWGGISGPELQNGSALSRNFSILNCIFKSNSHNTYLTDIDGLTFSSNRSYLSVRDGLRLYRNVKNCIITDNILWDNGNGDVGQSMDGMDLFVAGDTCIVANNVIYGNDGLGIDIKLSLDPAYSGETVRDQRYVISNNIIFSNANQGIRVNADWAGETRYVENIVISNNLVFSNTSYGIWVYRGRYCVISDNVVHSNGNTGIRLEQSIDATIQGNVAYNNSTIGINVINDCSYVTITNNRAVGGGAQTSAGIYVGGTSIRCTDNQSSGHTTDYYAEGQAAVLGKAIDVPFSNTTGSQFAAVMPRGSISGLETTFNGAVTAADITVAKRNPTTGAALHTLCNDLAAAQATSYVKATRTLNTTGSYRATTGGEAILISLANITSSFTTGRLTIHYID